MVSFLLLAFPVQIHRSERTWSSPGSNMSSGYGTDFWGPGKAVGGNPHKS